MNYKKYIAVYRDENDQTFTIGSGNTIRQTIENAHWRIKNDGLTIREFWVYDENFCTPCRHIEVE